ncbi:MAG: hypothetical protein GF331_15065 [Chitinivibrionales bacterium]|nr:hypothetical protein [Chitinivibrionales bacterium]
MHPEGWKPFVHRLKSPFNIALVATGALLVTDLLLGSPLMGKAVRLQLRLMNMEPSGDAARILTAFGTFRSVNDWTVFVERILIVFFFALPGLSYARGLFAAVSGR